MLQCRLHLCRRGFLVGRVTGLWYRQQQRHMFTLKLEESCHHTTHTPIIPWQPAWEEWLVCLPLLQVSYWKFRNWLELWQCKAINPQNNNGIMSLGPRTYSRSSHDSKHNLVNSGHCCDVRTCVLYWCRPCVYSLYAGVLKEESVVRLCVAG